MSHRCLRTYHCVIQLKFNCVPFLSQNEVRFSIAAVKTLSLQHLTFAAICQILERKEELAELESTDMGKPLDEALWDMVIDDDDDDDDTNDSIDNNISDENNKINS